MCAIKWWVIHYAAINNEQNLVPRSEAVAGKKLKYVTVAFPPGSEQKLEEMVIISWKGLKNTVEEKAPIIC